MSEIYQVDLTKGYDNYKCYIFVTVIVTYLCDLVEYYRNY